MTSQSYDLENCALLGGCSFKLCWAEVVEPMPLKHHDIQRRIDSFTLLRLLSSVYQTEASATTKKADRIILSPRKENILVPTNSFFHKKLF